ncbi:unnamed protein product [Closterium sp. Yama58-4]|nr:unnamed protein product [Closterium sp. Yama58-4]
MDSRRPASVGSAHFLRRSHCADARSFRALALLALLVVAACPRAASAGSAQGGNRAAWLRGRVLRRQIAQSQPQQVHVSLAGGGRALVWWVTAGNTPATVEYGESRGQYTKTASGSVSRYTLNGYTSGYIHKVMLGRPMKDGLLKPGTTYFYRLGGAGPERAFKTPPASSQPISVALVADMDSTPAAADTIARLSRTPHSLVVFPGDLSYANGYQPQWDTWQSLIQPAASLRPWMTGPGNHEDEADEGAPSSNPFKAYNARWPMPAAASGSSSNLFYSFDSGSIHWVVLSCYSDYYQGSAQYNWLQADLAKVDRKVTPWLMAAFHEPWYHSNKDHHLSGEDMRLALEKLLYDAHTDVVVCGHDMRLALEKLLYDAHTDVVVCGHVHAYERTDMRLALEKLLYDARTDVVVCGHVHAYERTMLYEQGGMCGVCGEDMRLALEKLLYDAHTDVVVCGHVHAYERTEELLYDARTHVVVCGHVHAYERTVLEKLLYDARTDAVVCGHVHAYERTVSGGRAGWCMGHVRARERLRYDAHTDVVVCGHVHAYERTVSWIAQEQMVVWRKGEGGRLGGGGAGVGGGGGGVGMAGRRTHVHAECMESVRGSRVGFARRHALGHVWGMMRFDALVPLG